MKMLWLFETSQRRANSRVEVRSLLLCGGAWRIVAFFPCFFGVETLQQDIVQPTPSR